MWQLLSVVAALSHLAASCIPPFLDGTNYSNFTEFAQSGALNHLNPTSGWSHVIDVGWDDSSPLKLWPATRRTEGIVDFPYCWKNQESKTRLEHISRRGFRLWKERIGPPGKFHGHVIGDFYEFETAAKTKPFCRNADGITWNPQVPADTIEIKHEGRWSEGEATTGYRYEDFDNRPGRHTIGFGTLPVPVGVPATRSEEVLIAVFAHEIGHIFGLMHEHQRADRDYHVHYDCEQLNGYAETKTRVEQAGQYTIDQVCNSAVLPYIYGNPIMGAFVTNTLYDIYLDPHAQNPFRKTNSKVYDRYSIMHYSSIQGGRYGSEPPAHMLHQGIPLLAWKYTYSSQHPPPDNPTADDVRWIQQALTPSPADITAVKEIYYFDDVEG